MGSIFRPRQAFHFVVWPLLAWMATFCVATAAQTTNLATAGTAAQSPATPGWPSKPIRIIVGYSPGGAVDIIARAIAQPLASSLGQTVIVENKPGAGTNIANRALIDSAPDGHILMLAANVSLYQPAPCDLARDLAPIAQVGRVPVVLAAGTHSEVSFIAQLIAVSKAKPGGINFGTPGNGSTPHLAIELVARAASTSLTHVPYKGGSQALNDVLAGHIQTVAVNALEVQPNGSPRLLTPYATKAGYRPQWSAPVCGALCAEFDPNG